MLHEAGLIRVAIDALLLVASLARHPICDAIIEGTSEQREMGTDKARGPLDIDVCLLGSRRNDNQSRPTTTGESQTNCDDSNTPPRRGFNIHIYIYSVVDAQGIRPCPSYLGLNVITKI